jgi:DNA ligase-4
MDAEIDFPRLHQPTELLKKPPIIEVIGAGFEKPADARFFTLRFPLIQKGSSRSLISGFAQLY